MAAHHFDNHHTIVASTGGVQSIDGLGGKTDSCVESESRDCPVQVIVNGFWDTHHGDAQFCDLAGDFHRAVTANRDQRVNFQVFKAV